MPHESESKGVMEIRCKESSKTRFARSLAHDIPRIKSPICSLPPSLSLSASQTTPLPPLPPPSLSDLCKILKPRASITLPDPNGSPARDAIRLAGPKPPDLPGVQLGLLRVLAGPEEVHAVVAQIAERAEVEGGGADARRRTTVRHGEADGLRLVGDDVHLLAAGGGGVDGLEGQAAGAAGDDEGLGVGLVLDLAEVGGAVGVGEVEGLELVDVEAAAADGEAEG